MGGTPPPDRFRDPLHTKYHYTDHILVRCPRCAGPAHVARAVSHPRTLRLVCRGCGLLRETERRAVHRWGARPATDPYFDEPLWLQAETRHGCLWAFNPEHLALIRQFVEAPLREGPAWYIPVRRMTLLARLPAWIVRRKNRAEVLHAIDRIRATLAE